MLKNTEMMMNSITKQFDEDVQVMHHFEQLYIIEIQKLKNKIATMKSRILGKMELMIKL